MRGLLAPSLHDAAEQRAWHLRNPTPVGPPLRWPHTRCPRTAERHALGAPVVPGQPAQLLAQRARQEQRGCAALLRACCSEVPLSLRQLCPHALLPARILCPPLVLHCVHACACGVRGMGAVLAVRVQQHLWRAVACSSSTR